MDGKIDISTISDVSDFALQHELVEIQYSGQKVDMKDLLDKKICLFRFNTVFKSGADHTKIQFFYLDDPNQTLYFSETMSKNLTEFLQKYNDKLPFKCQIKKFYKFRNVNYGFHTANA